MKLHLLLFLISESISRITSGCEDNTGRILCNNQSKLSHQGSGVGQVKYNEIEFLTFTIRVKYQEFVLHNHGYSSLYIRGNGLGLLRTKGKQLAKTNHDVWDVNITYISSLDGFRCHLCVNEDYLPDKKLQYRIMADDHQDMIGANFIIQLPVSEVSSYFEKAPVFTVYPWFFTKTGVIDSLLINSTNLGVEKNISLYTPPSFHENIYKTYPTVFVFDLNLEFASAFKREIENPIYPYAVAEEYVLIGFGDYNFTEMERVDLLTPTTESVLGCINGTFGNRCHGCIPVAIHTDAKQFVRSLERKCGKYYIHKGDRTLDFLEKDVFPFVNQVLNMRLQADNIGVMGYSLGALLSCYAVWTRPDVYSFAACQSPPFWMPINSSNPNITNYYFLTKILHDSAFQARRPEQRIYLDAGGAETDFPYRITQSAIEAAHIITQFHHYELNHNVWIFIDPGKSHSFTQWKKRISKALAILLPAKGSKRLS